MLFDFTHIFQTNKQTIAYEHFWATTQEASKIYKDKDTSDGIEERTKSLLDINPEGKLLREIKDILDELHIMINIKNKQQRVFKEFKKHVLHVIDPGLAMSKEIGTARPRDVRGNADEGETDESGKGKKPVKNEDDQKSQRDAKWTIEFALDLSAGLDDRIVDLNNLKESAEHTEKAVSSVYKSQIDFTVDSNSSMVFLLLSNNKLALSRLVKRLDKRKKPYGKGAPSCSLPSLLSYL